jgi:hypothetical protein
VGPPDLAEQAAGQPARQQNRDPSRQAERSEGRKPPPLAARRLPEQIERRRRHDEQGDLQARAEREQQTRREGPAASVSSSAGGQEQRQKQQWLRDGFRLQTRPERIPVASEQNIEPRGQTRHRRRDIRTDQPVQADRSGGENQNVQASKRQDRVAESDLDEREKKVDRRRLGIEDEAAVRKAVAQNFAAGQAIDRLVPADRKSDGRQRETQGARQRAEVPPLEQAPKTGRTRDSHISPATRTPAGTGTSRRR